MNMTSSDIKRVAKENMSFQWGASLLVIVLFIFLCACGNVIPVLGSMLILGPLTYGLTYIYYFQGSKKIKMEYWDLFKGFEHSFGETFLSALLVSIFTFLWSLLFVIPGIIKGFSYSMYMYLMVREPELTGMQAIEKSKQYMNGHKWQYFCLQLSFLGWMILTGLTGGILGIYTLPYMQHANIEFFNRVYEEKNPTIFAGEAETVEAEVVDVEAEVVEDEQTTSEDFIVKEAE